MHRIDGPGATVDNRFTDGDPVGGVQATIVTDDWANDVQEELISLLTAAGIAPVKGTQNQVLQAIRSIALSMPSSLQAVSGSVAGNALTLSWTPKPMLFRNPALANGAPVSATAPASLSLVVPSGATLGTAANQSATLVLLVAYNAGSPVLCVANLAGGTDLSETGLISPTTISAGSNSASIIYSSTAVAAGSPYRVVGCIQITEAVAGTWATAPTLVQGVGGQAMAGLQSLGYGQTWQNVTGSRAFGTTYYNTTSRPIMVGVQGNMAVGATGLSVAVSGVAVSGMSVATGHTACVSFIVPPGASYIVAAGSAVSSPTWSELR